MVPTVSRTELNEADDIIAEPGLVPVRRRPESKMFGSPMAGCEGKQSFDVRSLADTAARRSPGRTAYKCKFCRKWHVGGKVQKQK